MAEALVHVVLDHLASIIRQEAEGIRLIAGAEHKVEKLRSNFLAVQAVLSDAENRQVKDSTVRDWLYKLEDISYDIDDVLDQWNTIIQKLQVKEGEHASKPLRKVCFLIPYYLCRFRRLVLRYDVVVKIKNLDRKLDIISGEKDRFNFSFITKSDRELERPLTTSVIDLTMVHGRDEDKTRIVNSLLGQSSQEQVLPIISIVGMAGIGKTTLARLAFNDDKVKAHFTERIWVCVSEPFDEMRIARAILESITNDAPNLVELETVLRNIRWHIKRKKFLLVLDDIWTENPNSWEQLKDSLKCGSQESKILVTTRKENVANVIGTTSMISLGPLSEEGCWSLFSQVAFFGRTNYGTLKETGKKIVQKCKGLPLAVKTLGSLLRFKSTIEEWQNILNSEMWELKEVEQGLFPPLLLSYYDLPPMIRKCFLYCSIFPKNYVIVKNNLIKLWMAQDYLSTEKNKDMELVGEEYIEILTMRSFFQDFQNDEGDEGTGNLKIHDMVLDFAKFLTQNECFTVEVEDDGTAKRESESSYNKFRHSMIKVKAMGSFPCSIYTQKSLRSLLIKCQESAPGIILSKLFDQLISLRTLYLGDLLMNEISGGIKNLIHLRYLNLSNNNKLKELPETLCELYNLQTLDITYCENLQALPQGLGKLINLRHLENWWTSICYTPKSVERLIHLRTLGEFIISDGSYGSKACSLECLKNVNHIRDIDIKGLGNVTDVGEAKEAELKNKKNLRALGLNFDGRMNENLEVLLEALQPPSNLERLWIENYTGRNLLPRWIMSLTTLRRLGLAGGINCEHLPPLGKLSSLEFLDISYMKRVKRVGNEFLGIKSDDTSSSSSIISFPNLKYLSFWRMEEWEEWNYELTNGGEDIEVMPCLQTLKIQHCPKLMSLPNHLCKLTMMKKVIHGCPLLEGTLEN